MAGRAALTLLGAPLVLLLTRASVASADCAVSWSGKCGRYTATSNLVFNVTSDDASSLGDGSNDAPSYEADVIFHWGGTDEDSTDLGTVSYTLGQLAVEELTFEYDGGGTYMTGYEVTFGAGSGPGCEGMTFYSYTLVTFDDDRRTCFFNATDDTGTTEEGTGQSITTTPATSTPTWAPADRPISLAPTGIATTQPTTTSPTNRPTEAPTGKPTLRPTTSSPTDQPTPAPANDPTRRPTILITPEPTDRPVTPQPTEIGIDFSAPCGDGTCSDEENDDSCPVDCEEIRLETGIDGMFATDNAAGIMFVVRSKGRNVILRSIEIDSEAVGVVERVEVYTKPGDYSGHQSDRDAWKKVYDNYNEMKGVGEGVRLNLNNQQGVAIPEGDEVSFLIYTVAGQIYNEVDGVYIEVAGDSGDDALGIRDAKEVKEKWIDSGGPTIVFRGALTYDIVDSLPLLPPTLTPTSLGTPLLDTIEKTLSPTNDVTRPPSTLEPATPSPIFDLPNPVDEPKDPSEADGPLKDSITSSDSPADATSEVSYTMVLHYCDPMVGQSLIVWEEVTEATVLRGVVDVIGVDESLVQVDVQFVNQKTLESDLRSRRTSVRGLRSEPLPPLQIEFTTVIEVSSEADMVDFEKDEILSDVFKSGDNQQSYISSLNQADPHFGGVETVVVSGDLVSEYATAVDDESSQADREGGGGDGDGGSSSNTTIIVAAAAGGVALVVIATGIWVYRSRRRRQNETNVEKSFETQEEDKQVAPAAVASAAVSEGETQGETMEPESGQLYFGVIESREGPDDVSTIGEPWFGDTPNAVMDTDNTVGESAVSSQQDRYVYGVRKPQISIGMDAQSLVGDSTVGSKGMLFGDDATLEGMYQSPPGESTNEADPGLRRFRVAAPPGRLGIVLDNPMGDLPVVYAIKDTSSLNGQLRVGDVLLYVDEVDCRGMSAHSLSALLNSRSESRVRTLVLGRGLGNPAVTITAV